MIFFGFKPASLAASMLPPIAYTLRPNFVFARMIPNTTIQMIMIHTETGMFKILAFPRIRNVLLLMDTGFPPQMM